VGRLDDLHRHGLDGGLVLLEAVTRAQRGRGLARLPAAELPDGAGLRLACRSVHTIGMRFALDLVWLDRDGAVVRVDRAVAPRRLRTCLRARAVVETHAGGGEAFAAALDSAAANPRRTTS
jgi:uncharacterized membrane protein (UPF0127 family)